MTTHNERVEKAELVRWAKQPDQQLAYFSFNYIADAWDKQRMYRPDFYPNIGGAVVTLWPGTVIGHITAAHVYRHNFGSRMVSLKVRGTNGAIYHGKASYDNGTCVNLRKVR